MFVVSINVGGVAVDPRNGKLEFDRPQELHTNRAHFMSGSYEKGPRRTIKGYIPRIS